MLSLKECGILFKNQRPKTQGIDNIYFSYHIFWSGLHCYLSNAKDAFKKGSNFVNIASANFFALGP
jgi:hypothetical protein